MNVRNVLAGLAILFMIGTSIWADRTFFRSTPTPAKPDTVKKEIKVPKVVRDTVLQTRIETVTEYDTIEEVRYREIPLPKNFSMRGVLPNNYIDISPGNVEVTYWNPDQRRYVGESFNVAQTTRQFYLAGHIFAARGVFSIGPTIAFDSDHFRLEAGYGPLWTNGTVQYSPIVSASLKLPVYRF